MLHFRWNLCTVAYSILDSYYSVPIIIHIYREAERQLATAAGFSIASRYMDGP